MKCQILGSNGAVSVDYGWEHWCCIYVVWTGALALYLWVVEGSIGDVSMGYGWALVLYLWSMKSITGAVSMGYGAALVLYLWGMESITGAVSMQYGVEVHLHYTQLLN